MMPNKRGVIADTEPDAQKARILVVEDDEGIRSLLRFFLSDAGYEVSQACHGAEGLRRLLSEPFDLVVTDNSMPIKDGLAMIEEASSLAPEVRFVIYSGSSAEEVRQSSPSCEMNVLDILVKPMPGHELVAAIRDAMRRGALADVENQTVSLESIDSSERSASPAKLREVVGSLKHHRSAPGHIGTSEHSAYLCQGTTRMAKELAHGKRDHSLLDPFPAIKQVRASDGPNARRSNKRWKNHVLT